MIASEADIAEMAFRVPGLSRGPAAVVAVLNAAGGRIVPASELFEAVECATGRRSDQLHAVLTAIKRARAALRAAGCGRIVNHREIGYRLEWLGVDQAT